MPWHWRGAATARKCKHWYVTALVDYCEAIRLDPKSARTHTDGRGPSGRK